MSPEHKFYTSQIAKWAIKNFHHPGLDISDDNQDSWRPEKIFAIVEGEVRTCLPDFSAINIAIEPNLYILGEAKTSEDFNNRLSDADNQMNVMINFLKKQTYPILIYSVPNEILETVTNKIHQKLEKYNATNIRFEVIDQFYK